MYGRNPKSTAQIGGHPLHPMLIPFPITCLIGALVTDILFLNSGDSGFATASHWLLGFGIGTALVAATAGMIDYMGDDRIRQLGVALQHMLANVAAVVIAVINFAIRLDDPGAPIDTLGIYLSGATVLILGAGGATRGVLGPLIDEGPARICVANRTLSRAEEIVCLFAHAGVVHATQPQAIDERFDVDPHRRTSDHWMALEQKEIDRFQSKLIKRIRSAGDRRVGPRFLRDVIRVSTAAAVFPDLT